MKKFSCLVSVFVAVAAASVAAAPRTASVTETNLVFKTYPFSDPDPVPATEKTRYPYFFFDGTSAEGAPRDWRAVILENEHVAVTILPEIGGKIWGAVDKRTGRDFIYYNHVVKFRNISQRGPWCSGGIEFNFGIIGHGPWTATPVSYFTRRNDDGSVSCFISETELVTESTWQVEVNLPADAEGFLTSTTWFNGSGFSMPYYQWMNAAYSVRGNPSFEFPGGTYIGHDGIASAWPRDDEGHDLSRFSENAFGGAKSEHVLDGDNGITLTAHLHQATSRKQEGFRIAQRRCNGSHLIGIDGGLILFESLTRTGQTHPEAILIGVINAQGLENDLCIVEATRGIKTMSQCVERFQRFFAHTRNLRDSLTFHQTGNKLFQLIVRQQKGFCFCHFVRSF